MIAVSVLRLEWFSRHHLWVIEALVLRLGAWIVQPVLFAKHELRKRILERFREAGFAIPLPQRDVHLYRGFNQKEFLHDVSGKRPIAKSA